MFSSVNSMPISIIFGRFSVIATIILSIMIGNWSINAGNAAIKPSAKPIIIAMDAFTKLDNVPGSVSVFAICNTMFTIVGINVGRLFAMPFAKDTTRSRPSLIICGNIEIKLVAKNVIVSNAVGHSVNCLAFTTLLHNYVAHFPELRKIRLLRLCCVTKNTSSGTNQDGVYKVTWKNNTQI